MRLKCSNYEKSLENMCRAKDIKSKLENLNTVEIEIIDLGNGYGKFIRK